VKFFISFTLQIARIANSRQRKNSSFTSWLFTPKSPRGDFQIIRRLSPPWGVWGYNLAEARITTGRRRPAPCTLHLASCNFSIFITARCLFVKNSTNQTTFRNKGT